MTKQEKCSTSQKGRVVIHLGEEEKRVYKSDLQKYLNSGWSIGVSDSHKKSNSLSHLGKCNEKLKNVPKSNEHKAKISNTLKKKYESNEISVWNKNLTIDNSESIRKYTNSRKETMLRKYGTLGTNTGKKFTDEHKRKIGEANKISLLGKKLSKEDTEKKTARQYLTKKKNGTFNTSKPEIEYRNILIEQYGKSNVKTNYKDKDRYPFYCDFYIPSEDLFIELNKHWTHGFQPYVEDNLDCQKQLLEWKERAKTSKFYQNAIYTWTVRDVEKLRIAKENNLNYKIIY